MDGIAKIEMIDDCGRVSSIMVHVVAVRHLARAPMGATVDADHAIAFVDEEKHLGIPVVRAEWPAMMEDDGLAVAPILVENINTILSFNEAHRSLHKLQKLA